MQCGLAGSVAARLCCFKVHVTSSVRTDGPIFSVTNQAYPYRLRIKT